MRRAVWCLGLLAVAAGAAPEPGRVEAPGLHNVFRLTDRLYSGSSPEGDAGFASLRRLGIRTVITVDGAPPEVERARRFGLRYVHLRFGYDGIPRAQAVRLTRALAELPGPFYIHCHHGMHRAPAAAAVARLCLDGRCPVETVVAEMHRAGTDPRYKGLYAAPREFRRPTAAELARVPADLPESVPPPALVEHMVAIDCRLENLKQARAAGWRAPPGRPGLDAAHEALQLVEHFREAARLDAARRRPADFRQRLAEAEAAAADLEAVLRAGKVDGTAAERAYRRAAAQCSGCHAEYRDRPRTP